MTPQVHAAHPARLIQVRIRAFHSFAAASEESFPAGAANASPIGIDGVAVRPLIDPALRPAIRFTDVRPHAEGLQLQDLPLTVIALVGHDFLAGRHRVVGDHGHGDQPS